VASYRVGLVRLLEMGDLFGCQLHGQRPELVVKLLSTSDLYDRGGYHGLAEQPSERHLSPADASLGCHVGHGLEMAWSPSA
jgi:hypothetical protein